MENNEKVVKKLIIINEESLLSLFKKDEGELSLGIRRFIHPKTNEPRLFLMIPDVSLFELVKYEPEISSAFIDNHVQSAFNMCFATKFNVNYFLISILYNKPSEYLSLENICINDESTKEEIYLKQFINSKELEILFDVSKEETNELRIKFNLEKCLNWLKNKVLQLENYLKSIDIKIERKEIKNIKNEDQNKMLISSFELIAQYINQNLHELLHKELNLNELIETTQPSECKRVKSSIN